MNAGTYLAAVERLPFGDLDDLTRRQPFLVVAPHQDDETLGCAGLMAAAQASGIPLKVVVATDGGASHPNSRAYPRERLRRLRRDESIAAAEACGIGAEQLTFLDFADASLPGDLNAMSRLTEALVQEAHAFEARSMFVTWRGDPHGDHEVVHDSTRAAARRLGLRLWSYPIWGWRLSPETPVAAAAPTGHRFDIALHVEAKRRAIDCHRSQTTRLIFDDPDGFILAPEMLARFYTPVEYFLREDA